MAFDTFETIRPFVLRCKTCGKEIPSGIVSLSEHWANCSGKGFVEAIMKLAEKTNGKLTESDIDAINKNRDS